MNIHKLSKFYCFLVKLPSFYEPAVPLESVFRGLHQEVQGDDHDGHEEGSVPHLRRRWRISRWWFDDGEEGWISMVNSMHARGKNIQMNELWTRHDIVMVFQLRSCFGVEKYQVSVTASWFHHMVPIGCPIRWNPSPRPMSRRERSCTSPPVSLHPSRLSGCYSPPADPRWKPRLFTSYRNGPPR